MIEVTDEMLKVARSMQSFELMIKRIIELHEANKPKPEPYRYISENTGECVLPHELPEDLKTSGRWKPLYTHQQPNREPLSEEAMNQIIDNHDFRDGFYSIIRLAEKAHGIGVE